MQTVRDKKPSVESGADLKPEAITEPSPASESGSLESKEDGVSSKDEKQPKEEGM